MIHLVIRTDSLLDRYNKACKQRKLSIPVYSGETYLIGLDKNRVTFFPANARLGVVNGFDWSVDHNELRACCFENITQVYNAYNVDKLIHTLITKLMVKDMPNDQITQSIQALKPNYKPTFKLVKNFLTEGLMVRQAGSGPQEGKSPSFEDFVENLMHSISDELIQCQVNVQKTLERQDGKVDILATIRRHNTVLK